LREKGDIDEAIVYLKKGIGVNAFHAPAYNELGLAQKQKGLIKEALNAFKKAIRIDNCIHRPFHNIGKMFFEKEKFRHAKLYFKRAIALNSQAVDSMRGLVALYKTTGELDKAIETHAMIEHRRPEDPEIWASGLWIHVEVGRWEKADRYLKKLLRYSFSVEETDTLQRLLAVLPRTYASLAVIKSKFEEYGRLMSRQYKSVTPAFDRGRYDGERLRIGYISHDFRGHPVGFFAKSILENHCRKTTKTVCYSLNVADDEVTGQIGKLCSTFRPVAELSVEEIARLIRDDRIQVLIDLAGHTNPKILKILAMKPAPVIICHVGYAAGTGLPSVDYKLTDYFADGQDAADHYSEKLIRLPGCAYPYVPSARQDGPISRRSCGIPESAVTFAAFCPVFKLNGRLLKVWKRITDSVADAFFIFSPEQKYRKYILEMTSACGILPDVIRFLDFSRKTELDAIRYGVVDIALDTFPYGGGMTSMNALNMTVPVVTLKGRRHGERMTYSILRNLGVDQTIADSEDGYVRIAKRLAEDSAFRFDVQSEIRKGLADSPLVDMKTHVSHLEFAYRTAWQRFLDGKPPQEIRI